MSQHSSKQTDITPGLQPGFFQHAAAHVGVGMGCFAFVVAAMLNGESDLKGQVKLLSSHRKQHRS